MTTNQHPAYDFSALSDRALDTMLRILGEALDVQVSPSIAFNPNRGRMVEKEAALEAERARRDDALIEALEKGVEAGEFRVFDPAQGIEQFA